MRDMPLWILSLSTSALSLVIAIDSHRMQRHAHKITRHLTFPHLDQQGHLTMHTDCEHDE